MTTTRRVRGRIDPALVPRAGAVDYPHSTTRLLITAEAGGSNSYRYEAWKAALASLASQSGLAITACPHLAMNKPRPKPAFLSAPARLGDTPATRSDGDRSHPARAHRPIGTRSTPCCPDLPPTPAINATASLLMTSAFSSGQPPRQPTCGVLLTHLLVGRVSAISLDGRLLNAPVPPVLALGATGR